MIIALKPAQAKRATLLADDTKCDIALVHKFERKEGYAIVGDVKDKVAIIVQDIADTCSM